MQSHSSDAPRYRQHGQALVLTLVMLGALTGALIWLFNAGQLANDQRRLDDAVDAAAWSGAVWQARALNFDAYTNRAVVANDAAIAQAVSLRSWGRYLKDLLPKTGLVLRWIPGVNVAYTAVERIWSRVEPILQTTLIAEEATLSAVDTSLAVAQETFHDTAIAAASEVTRRVLSMQTPAAQLTVQGSRFIDTATARWLAVSSRYSGAQRTRQADVVSRSLDGFTRQRNTSLTAIVIKFEKRGSTDRIGLDTWRGLDTFALHRRQGFLVGGFRETLPIGWGGAENGTGSARRGLHGGSWRSNPRTSRLAQNSQRVSTSYRGLPALRDLSAASLRLTPTIRWLVAAEHPAAQVPLASRVWRTRADDAPTVAPQSISAAEVRFERIERRGSSDLSAWNPGPTQLYSAQQGDGTLLTEWQDDVSLESSPTGRRFLRLQLTGN